MKEMKLTKINKNKIISILLLLGLLLLIPFVIRLVKQRQEIRKRAQGSGVVEVKLDPESASKLINESFDINVTLTSKQDVSVGGATIRLSYNPTILTISDLTCSTPFSTPQANVIGDNYINAGCHVGGAGAFIPLTTGVKVTLGKFRVTPKQAGETRIDFVQSIVGDSEGNDLSDAGTTATYTIGAAATSTPVPTIPPGDRCRITVEGGQTHTRGDQVRINVTQNPKFADNDACYYRTLDVKDASAGDQIVCTASNFGIIEGRTPNRSCDWNTSGASLGNHELRVTYGGHNHGCPNEPCCDGGYNCDATITLNAPPTSTPTPPSEATATPIPTPTTTVAPGNVKIQFKIKFSGVNEQRPAQRVKVTINSGVLSSTLATFNNVNVTSVNTSTDADQPNWVYQSEVLTLPTYFDDQAKQYNGYYLLIKGPKHLATRYCNSTINNRPCAIPKTTLGGLCLGFGCYDGIYSFDFTGYPLPGGDLPPQDGVVNAIDATVLTDCLATPTDATCLAKADLNFDGNISSADTVIMNNTIYTRWEDD